MRHILKLKRKEKINIWLDLCDFTFKLLKGSLSAPALRKRLKKTRQAHLGDDYAIWSKLSKLK